MNRFNRRAVGGFTLAELMIVLVIVAILMTVALPAYKGYQQKSRRGDATTSLMRAQLEQEKWRAEDTNYGTLAEIWTGSDSLSGYYSLAVTTNDAAAFVVTATPKIGGPQVGDDCGTFAVNESGPLHTGYADAACWGK